MGLIIDRNLEMVLFPGWENGWENYSKAMLQMIKIFSIHLTIIGPSTNI